MTSEGRILIHSNANELAHWCGGKLVVEQDALNSEVTSPGINVPVGDEVKRASVGDVIIRKDDGSFDIFKN